MSIVFIYMVKENLVYVIYRLSGVFLFGDQSEV